MLMPSQVIFIEVTRIGFCLLKIQNDWFFPPKKKPVRELDLLKPALTRYIFLQ